MQKPLSPFILAIEDPWCKDESWLQKASSNYICSNHFPCQKYCTFAVLKSDWWAVYLVSIARQSKLGPFQRGAFLDLCMFGNLLKLAFSQREFKSLFFFGRVYLPWYKRRGHNFCFNNSQECHWQNWYIYICQLRWTILDIFVHINSFMKNQQYRQLCYTCEGTCFQSNFTRMRCYTCMYETAWFITAN